MPYRAIFATANAQAMYSGFVLVTLTSGSKAITIDYRSVAAGVTAVISNARLVSYLIA